VILVNLSQQRTTSKCLTVSSSFYRALEQNCYAQRDIVIGCFTSGKPLQTQVLICEPCLTIATVLFAMAKFLVLYYIQKRLLLPIMDVSTYPSFV